MNKIKMLAALPVAAAAVTVALLGASPASAAAASASVSPATGATVGSSVTVTGSGWPASGAFLVQCKGNAADGSQCDKTVFKPATVTAAGTFTFSWKVTSYCTSTCYILVTTATQSPTVFAPFTVGGGAASSSSAAPTSAATSSAAAAGTGSEPTAVNAGSGGHAGEQGIPTGVVLLAGAGVIGLGLGARRFARR